MKESYNTLNDENLAALSSECVGQKLQLTVTDDGTNYALQLVEKPS